MQPSFSMFSAMNPQHAHMFSGAMHGHGHGHSALSHEFTGDHHSMPTMSLSQIQSQYAQSNNVQSMNGGSGSGAGSHEHSPATIFGSMHQMVMDDQHHHMQQQQQQQQQQQPAAFYELSQSQSMSHPPDFGGALSMGGFEATGMKFDYGMEYETMMRLMREPMYNPPSDHPFESSGVSWDKRD
jgi:hypothetical protein